MDEPKPRRVWWRRKRLWAAGFLWIFVAYPLTSGPAIVAVGRGWLSLRLYAVVYWPVVHGQNAVLGRVPEKNQVDHPIVLWNDYWRAVGDPVYRAKVEQFRQAVLRSPPPPQISVGNRPADRPVFRLPPSGSTGGPLLPPPTPAQFDG